MTALIEAAPFAVPQDRRPRVNRLSADEALHALYVDFEGRIGKPPVLLGCARRPGRRAVPWVWQALLDPVFEPLADKDDLPLTTLQGAVERIVVRAEANDVPIVAWSEHELQVVREHCDAPLVERFEGRFVNAKKIASRWTSTLRPDVRPASRHLADYLVYVSHAVPDGAGPGHAGDAIRILAEALERGRGVAGLTVTQRRRWEQLRDHNRHDCDGMRDVCIRATVELEAAERSRARSRSPRRRIRRRARAR